MSRSRRALAVPAVLVLALAVRPAAAQSTSPPAHLQLGVAGGLTPATVGAWDRGYAGGAHAQVSLGLARALGPVGVRADAFVHGFRRGTLGGALSRRTTIPGAAASLVLPLVSATVPVRPYVLAGGGAYQTEYGGGTEWHVGLSGGAGAEFGRGRVGAFVEARVHQVYDGSTPRLIPVSLGLRF